MARVAEASVDPTKTLASFDFAAVPELDRGRFTDLATAAFVPRAENVILAGPSGVGNDADLPRVRRGVERRCDIAADDLAALA